MDKKDIIRELIGIALEAGPSPAAVEERAFTSWKRPTMAPTSL